MAKNKQNKKPAPIKKEEAKPNTFKEKAISFLKDLGLSTIKTKNLFRFAHRHWITPLVTFIIITMLLVIPPYLRNTNMSGDEVVATTGVFYSDQALSYALSTDVKCKVNEEASLVCEEGYKYVELKKEFKDALGNPVYFDIFINAKDDIDALDEQAYFQVKDFIDDGDNYIALYNNQFVMRYVIRDSYNKQLYRTMRLAGLYTGLEGLDLHLVYENASKLEAEQAEAKFNETADEIIATGFKAAQSEQHFISLSNNLLSYILLIAVSSLLIKGIYLFRRDKGLSFTQGIKIVVMSSLQAYPIALIISLLVGGLLQRLRIDTMTIFGLIVTIRMLYIWLRYTSSKNNTAWLDDLYEFSGNERFNVKTIDEKAK